jgi:hypothetical protein
MRLISSVQRRGAVQSSQLSPRTRASVGRSVTQSRTRPDSAAGVLSSVRRSRVRGDLSLHHHLEALNPVGRVRNRKRRRGPRSEPTLDEVRRTYEPRPVKREEEVTELVGMCLWDVFSDNHEGDCRVSAAAGASRHAFACCGRETCFGVCVSPHWARNCVMKACSSLDPTANGANASATASAV